MEFHEMSEATLPGNGKVVRRDDLVSLAPIEVLGGMLAKRLARELGDKGFYQITDIKRCGNYALLCFAEAPDGINAVFFR